MRDDESETLSSNEMELEEEEILGHLSVTLGYCIKFSFSHSAIAGILPSPVNESESNAEPDR